MSSRLIPVYKTPLEAAAEALSGGGESPAVRIAGSARIQTGQAHNIGTDARSVIGSDPHRRAVIFKNEGAVDVYVGAEGVTTTSGFRLGIGQAVTLETSAEVWAVTPTGATGDLHYITELDE